jgi:zinc protease
MRGLRTLARRASVLLLAWSAAGSAAASPAIEHWTTERGAAVYFVAAPEIPMLDVRLVFAAGSARDGARPGVAALTNDLLTEGTATLSPDEFHGRLDATGAILGSGSLRDMAWLSLRTLTRAPERATSLGLLADLLRAPRLDEANFARQRDQALAGLKRALESPGTLGSRAFFRALYGDHPYASPPEGTAESLARLTLADLRDFHARHYVARNLTLAIVGALSRDEAAALAESLSASLPVGEPAPALPPLPPYAPVTEHIEFSSAQSHVFVGQRGLARDDPDYFPLLVGNYSLGGGGFVSRLMKEVREKRGYAYSVYSYFAPRKLEGPFEIGLQTKREQVGDALKVVDEVLTGYIATGPTAKELAAAKKNMVDGLALRMDSNAKLLGYLSAIGFYGLPLTYLDEFPAKVNAVTVEQVKAAFGRHVKAENLVTVIVAAD